MKKIHRFLVDSIPDVALFTLDEPGLIHQVHAVLALRAGEDITIFTDGGPDERVTIEKSDRDKLSVRRKETIDTTRTRPPLLLTVGISIPKGTTLELIVQKLTELGVYEIVPIISGRTVKAGVRMERLRSISDEALEQCGGSNRVRVQNPLPLSDALAKYSLPSLVCEYGGASLTDVLQDNAEQLMLYIGPEGGWSEDDLHLFDEAGIQRINLGERILRTDTAAIAAAYALLWGK